MRCTKLRLPYPLLVALLSLSIEGANIALGDSHCGAMLTDGKVKCWGSNINGQLGDGTTTSSTTPVEVTGIITMATSVALGGSHSCVVLMDA